MNLHSADALASLLGGWASGLNAWSVLLRIALSIQMTTPGKLKTKIFRTALSEAP